MAYRRSYARRRAQGSRTRTGQGGGSAGRMLLGLLAVAAVLYFVTASAAGNWLSENIVNPVLEAFNPVQPEAAISRLTPPPAVAVDSGVASEALPEPVETLTASATPSQAAGGKEFKTDGATVYAIQMGAFKSEENAGKEADVVRTRGGAGYVYRDGELYRVFASAYATEAEAQAVRAQLKEEEIDSGVFALEIKEVELRVTAGESVIGALNGALSALGKARSDMLALSISYDKKEKTQAEAAQAADAMSAELKAAIDKLKAEAGGGNVVIEKLTGCMNGCIEKLDGLVSDSKASELDFSSKMKYTQIELIAYTIEFVSAITASSN